MEAPGVFRETLHRKEDNVPLNIKNEQAHELAKELAKLTDTSITEAVIFALREAVEHRSTRYQRKRTALFNELQTIAEFTASLPVYDDGNRHFRRFGKGRHAAGLNYGDCSSYALAVAKEELLLYTGKGFSETDIHTIEY